MSLFLGLSFPRCEMGVIQGTPPQNIEKSSVFFMEHSPHIKHFRNMMGSFIPT